MDKHDRLAARLVVLGDLARTVQELQSAFLIEFADAAELRQDIDAETKKALAAYKAEPARVYLVFANLRSVQCDTDAELREFLSELVGSADANLDEVMAGIAGMELGQIGHVEAAGCSVFVASPTWLP